MKLAKVAIVSFLAVSMLAAMSVTVVNIGTISNVASARTATDFSNATVRTLVAPFSPGNSDGCMLYVNVTSLTGGGSTVMRLRWQPTSVETAAIMCATSSITVTGGYTCATPVEGPLTMDGLSIESTTTGTITDMDYNAYIACIR